MTKEGAGIYILPTLTFYKPEGPATDYPSANGCPSGTPILRIVKTFPFEVRMVVDLALIPSISLFTSSLILGLVAF